MENKYIPSFMEVLDAFERVYGPPNPIKVKSKEIGKDLTLDEFVSKYGPIESHYPETVDELIPFNLGYAGCNFELPDHMVFKMEYLKNPSKILAYIQIQRSLSKEFKREMNRKKKKILNAYKKGLETRKSDFGKDSYHLRK